jgi:hypothetical protein
MPKETNPTDLLAAVASELKRQKIKWGDGCDEGKTPDEWHCLIADYLGWARRMHAMDSPEKAVNRYLQVAALAVSAGQSIVQSIVQKREAISPTCADRPCLSVFNGAQAKPPPSLPSQKPCLVTEEGMEYWDFRKSMVDGRLEGLLREPTGLSSWIPLPRHRLAAVEVLQIHEKLNQKRAQLYREAV